MILDAQLALLKQKVHALSAAYVQQKKKNIQLEAENKKLRSIVMHFSKEKTTDASVISLFLSQENLDLKKINSYIVTIEECIAQLKNMHDQ